MINMSGEPKFNFIRSARSGVPYAFIVLVLVIFLACLANVILLYQYFSLGVEIRNNNILLVRYEQLSKDVSLPEDIDLKLKEFQDGLAKVERLGINVVGHKAVLYALEKNKPKEILFTKIEYNSLAGRCILEFIAIKSSSASELLKSFENMKIFKSVTILQRDRSGDNEKYLVDIRI